MGVCKRTVLAASVLLALPIVHAEEDPAPRSGTHSGSVIEEVTVVGSLTRYSATKTDTPIMNTARSVTIEDAQDLIDKGALALDAAYTYSAGITGETYGFATRGDWVKIRGLDAAQYQDSLQSLFGNYNNSRPHIDTLEQVEMLKGPASVLYGKGSPGGLVNVVSKRPGGGEIRELKMDAGSFDRIQMSADIGGDISEHWQYRLVSVYRDSDTQIDFVEDDAEVIAPSIRFAPNEDTAVTLLLNHSKTDGDTGAQFLPTVGTELPSPNGLEIDPDTYTGDPEFNHYRAKTESATLLAEHRLNEHWFAELSARYTEGEVDYQQAWTSFLGGGERFVYNPDGSLYKNGLTPRTYYRNDATSDQKVVDARVRADFEWAGWRHEWLFGAQYQNVVIDNAGYYLAAIGYDFATGQADAVFGDRYWLNPFAPVYDQSPPESLLNSFYRENSSTETDDSGVYVSNQLKRGPWHINLGLRYDETRSENGSNRQDDEAVSSSAGVLYRLDNGWAPYASIATSFEPVIGDNGAGQPLDPQEGKQREVGVKYQPDTLPMALTLAWFDLEQSNLNDPSALAGTVQQQRGVAEVRGLELEAKAHWPQWSLELNASRLNHQSAEGFRLASIPEKQASMWMTYYAGDRLTGLRAGFGLRYTGESYDGLDQLKTDSHTLADLMLGYHWQQWDLALNVRNLADESYFSTCLARGDCFPGKERTVVTTLRYRLN